MKTHNYLLFRIIMFCSFLFLFFGAVGQPTLSFRVTNPRIIRISGTDRLQFLVEVKASFSGTYFTALQATFNTTAGAFTPSTTFTPVRTGLSADGSKYPTLVGNVNVSGRIGISLSTDHQFDPILETMSDFYDEMPSDWTPLFIAQVRIANNTKMAGLGWNTGLMDANQFFQDPLSENTFNYAIPNSYDPNTMQNLYLGRIFSAASTFGWSQVGGPANGVQFLNWTASVNTSVWDGLATITQTDFTEAKAAFFRIESGATLTIPANKWLTVDSNMTIIGTVTNLMVASGASLIQNTPGIQATVGRDIGAWGDASHGWHLLSSPVAGQGINPEFTPSDGYDFYKWGETDNLWLNQKLPGNNITNFDPGIGYLVAYQSASTKVFTGPLNVSDISGIALTRTPGAYSGDITPGWNLLGNPYSSAITWHTGWSLPPSISSNAKIWQDGTYASYVDVAPGGIIPATQGFMVETSDAETVAIPAAARTHNSIPWYKSTGNPYLKLVASNPAAQTAQECVVTFDSQSLPGYDPAYDSRFLPGYAPYFYSVDGIEHLSTNVLQELSNQTTIPIDFVKTVGSDYVIEAVAMENFTRQVYLTDLKINQTQIMAVNQVYNFTAADGDDPARFLLTFGPMVGAGEKVLNSTGIYAYNNNLYIVNPGKATLEVFSLTGQKLHTLEIDNTGIFLTTLFLPTAYYVVRLTTGAKVVVSKVFLKS